MTRAIVLHETGGPEKLRWETVEVGEPGADELRIRHTAIGVNFHDTYVRSGSYRTLTLPGIPGVEAAGVVERVGPGVSGFAPGNRVCYIDEKYGGYAEARLLPARLALRIPDGLSDEAAAALTVKGLTACMLLRRVHAVHPGERLLVHAAGGAVGQLLVRWAKHLGATVITTVGSAEKARVARECGADGVIRYREEDFVARDERRHRARAMSAGLFAVKAICAAAEAGEQPLIRVLSLPSLTAFGIGSIIGTGIFVLTGTAAANHAGPALVISFLLAGCAGAFAALSYAELASMIPIAGSAYSYAYATLGELAAWFIGWNLVLEYTFSVGTVAVGWSAYVVSLLAQFGIQLPEALIQAPIDRGPGDVGLIVTGAVLNLPAVLIVAVVAYICYIGIRQSAAINFAFVVLKIAVVLGFVLLGAGFVNPANWHPLVPANTGHFGHFGWSGVFAAAGIMFFAFIGFDTV